MYHNLISGQFLIIIILIRVMKKSNLIEKLFGSFAPGSSRVPLRSNIVRGSGGGYKPIGGSASSRAFGMDKKSPLLGNSSPSTLISGYYERVAELKGYQLLDISKLATNFFSDYVLNFLTNASNGNLLSISNVDGSTNEQVTERLNEILTKDIKIVNFIKNHLNDYIYFGEYFGILSTSLDEYGHQKFSIEEINDPVSVITKRVKSKELGKSEDIYLAKGDDGSIYEIPKNSVVFISTSNLRLVNDLSEENEEGRENFNKSAKNNTSSNDLNNIFNKTSTSSIIKKMSADDPDSNKNKVLKKEAYIASEPLLYSLILKVKELVIKELLVSLLSLRDLSSVQLFLLQFDKSVPLETANNICAKATKLANNTNELASFLTAQFDAISFIENALTQPAKFIPDYNSSLAAKNAMLPLDKLSEKMIEIMQMLDHCKASILGPLGLPSTLMDSTSGSKWQVLQQSERANSRVTFYINGIKESVTKLVCNIYETIYKEELDPSRVTLHICEKTSVEYNNRINQSESINGMLTSISQVLQSSLTMLESSAPLINPEQFLSYIQKLIKDVDPDADSLITEESISMYVNYLKAKISAGMEQMGVDPNTVFNNEE